MAATGIYLQMQNQLQVALQANINALAALSSNPRPDGSVDGQSNSWTGLRASLLKEQRDILQRIQDMDGAFEVNHLGR